MKIRAEWPWLLLILVVALVPRLFAYFTWPVGGDEVVVVGRQIELFSQALSPFDLWAILVDVPLTASNGVTPLWGWLQTAIYYFFAGHPLSIRLLPLTSSILCIASIYFLTLRYMDRRTAIFTALVASFSDLGIYLAVNSEMTECFLLLCTLVSIFFLAKAKRNTFLGFSCLALASFTYFGKGIFILLVMLVWLFVVDLFPFFFEKEKLQSCLKKCLESVFYAGLAFIPVFLWLWFAQRRIDAMHLQGLVIQTDLGQARSILQVIRQCSVDYFKIRGFHASGPKAAMMLYSNLPAWPTSTLLFPLFVVGMILVLKSISRERDCERRAIFLLIPVFGLGVLFYLLFKGIDGERFHFFYHHAFVLGCGIALKNISDQLDVPRKAAPFLLLVWVYWAVVANFTSWRYADFNLQRFVVTAMVIFLVVALSVKWNVPRARWLFNAYLLLMAYVLWNLGPLYWGRFHVHGMPAFYSRSYEEKLVEESPDLVRSLYLSVTNKGVQPLPKNSLRPEWRHPGLQN